MSKNEKIEVVRGSGNVFRDAGLPNPDLLQAKSRIAGRIIQVLDDKGLTVSAAHKETGFDIGDLSRIRNADLSRFTLDRLIKIYAALDADTEVELKFSPRSEPARKGTSQPGQEA